MGQGAVGLRAAVGATGVLGILVAMLGMTPPPHRSAPMASLPSAFGDACAGGLLGDVTGDDVVSVTDAQQIARASAALPVNATVSSRLSSHGDVTDDGSTDIIDAQQIARWANAEDGCSGRFRYAREAGCANHLRRDTRQVGVGRRLSRAESKPLTRPPGLRSRAEGRESTSRGT